MVAQILPALFALLACVLVYCAVTDWRWLLIKNHAVLAVLVLCAARWLLLPESFELGDLWLAVGVLVVSIVTFELGLIVFGAGDLKLLSALALWFGLPDAATPDFVELAIATGVLGMAVVVLHVVGRFFWRPDPSSVVFRHVPWLFLLVNRVPQRFVEALFPYMAKDGGKFVPYGLAIVPAALWLMTEQLPAFLLLAEVA